MEKIESINDALRRLFGLHSDTGRSLYRVVWANDEYEKRLCYTTDSGVELLQPEVREVPKYPWSKDLYVLERLTEIPFQNLKDLPTQKLSYEPLWTFIGANNLPVPPTTQACKYIIETVKEAMERGTVNAKYAKAETDPNAPITNEQDFLDHEKKKLDNLQEELFGEQSGLKQAIVSGEGIAVPSNYKGNKEIN